MAECGIFLFPPTWVTQKLNISEGAGMAENSALKFENSSATDWFLPSWFYPGNGYVTLSKFSKSLSDAGTHIIHASVGHEKVRLGELLFLAVLLRK